MLWQAQRLYFCAGINSYILVFLYNISIALYLLALRIASIWNKKAKEWLTGRKDLFEYLEKNIKETDKIIWVHCSSAGEFEQGKPIIEQLKKDYPLYKILATFFSPSGYAVGKKYQHVDLISYLPIDTSSKARRFVEIVHPELVIFVKYEFWYHHISAIAFRHIPLLLVSAVFRKDQIFFKWYGKFYRQILFQFRHLFVQDKDSLEILKANGINHCSIGGDTRFDRVKGIAGKYTEIPFIGEFIGNNPVLVAGSTWQDDENLLNEYIKEHKNVKLIVAPHEINAKHLNELMQFRSMILYSVLTTNNDISPLPNKDNPTWVRVRPEQAEKLNNQMLQNVQVLIIDGVGMLARLYNYATICYVGGGFTKDGIHNTLEAAVYGKPVIFGPNYKKYREAKELIAEGGGFSISTPSELKNIIDDLIENPEHLQLAGTAAKNYVYNNTGATEKIVRFIQENRLLTN
jgi:3-deoxy-D-manno-octulosonic-acid transferase